METSTILFLRSLFLKTFLVGLLLAILLAAATLGLKSIWMPLMTDLFQLSENEVSGMVFGTLLNVRIVLLFFLLAPGLALHWMAKERK